MKTEKGYVLDLDQFERELTALVSDLRVDEKTHADLGARQEAYLRTGKRHGFRS